MADVWGHLFVSLRLAINARSFVPGNNAVIPFLVNCRLSALQTKYYLIKQPQIGRPAGVESNRRKTMLIHFVRLGANTRRLLLAALLLVITPGVAQFPDKFTNLQVLSKDISKAELQSTMRSFVFALNVRCPFCHVQKVDMSFDYPADDKDTKKTARIMLQMVAAINHDYVGKIGKPTPIQVECVTCHRGLTQPRPLLAVLAEAMEKQGLEKTVALYHDLRKQYYGTGQYDFGETPLNQLTESLLAKDRNKEAVAIMELNFAANSPGSVWAYHMLAMSHEANGEIDKAKADYRKVIELHPEDTWAKEQLDSLSSRK